MDAAKYYRNMSDPAWRRWLLLGALVVLGSLYIVAYAVFVVRSKDYIVVQRNQRARAFSREHVINQPAKLLFGLGGNNDAHLGGGWHNPDPNGVWSAQEDAWIELAVNRADSDLFVLLNTTAFVAKRHPRITIAVDVNGIELGSWARDNTNASEPLDIPVPRSIGQTGQLDIHLHIDHGESPVYIHVGPDRRQLGLFLSSIELRESR